MYTNLIPNKLNHQNAYSVTRIDDVDKFYFNIWLVFLFFSFFSVIFVLFQTVIINGVVVVILLISCAGFMSPW